MSEQAGRPQRSFNGLLGALAMSLIVIAVFVGLRGLSRSDPADPVRAVDYRQAVRFFRTTAPFHVLAPRTLPAGWIATSVRVDDAAKKPSWHLGMLTSDRHYLGLEQAQRPAGALVTQYVDPDAQRGGEVDIDGTTWRTYTDPGRSATDPDGDPEAEGDLALVREGRDVTTVVVGPVSQQVLTEFVRLLR